MIPDILTLPLLELASGDRLFLQVYTFRGATPGKKVYLQANLHGAEIAGNAVIHHLIDELTQMVPGQLAGEIWLVPVCNPLGTNQRSHYFASGRFNAYDGKDWNRIFWDFEREGHDLLAIARSLLTADLEAIQQHYRQQIRDSFTQATAALSTPSSAPVSEHYRAHLQSLCLDADYVIDLHTSATYGTDYLYYFRDRDDSALTFQLPIGILLDQYDGNAFDEAFIQPWLALEACFAQLDRPLRFDIEAWTLELGSAMQLNPTSVANGLRGIKNYLTHKGVLLNAPIDTLIAAPIAPVVESVPAMKLVSRNQVKKYYAPTGGMIQGRVELGCTVETGQPLYQILRFNKEGQLPTQVEITAERSGFVYDLSINHAVNQGEYVMGIIED